MFEQLKQVEHTPAYVYNEEGLRKRCELINARYKKAGVKQLFPLKCNSFTGALQIINEYVDGFAASSLYEVRLARDIAGAGKPVHVTTPGLRYDEFDEIQKYADGASFNSISQWLKNKPKMRKGFSAGLRINPKISFVDDERYDPCRRASKLGVPVEHLMQASRDELEGISGFHIHVNCDSSQLDYIDETVQSLCEQVPDFIKASRWANLGGGHHITEQTNTKPLEAAVERLKSINPSIEVSVEPGAALVATNCHLVAAVTDMFEVDGTKVAVLDTSVNHMPEVFEYQYKPDIVEESETGAHAYSLVGSTCLAGDSFGVYRFEAPLEVGSRVIFENTGAYTHVKAHMFNGVNMPSIYVHNFQTGLLLRKQYSYDDFLNHQGGLLSR